MPATFFVGKALGGGGGLAWVGLVILAEQFELCLLAADHDAFRVGVLDRQSGPVLAILPMWAMGPVSGPACPIFTVMSAFAALAQRRERGKGKKGFFMIFLG